MFPYGDPPPPHWKIRQIDPPSPWKIRSLPWGGGGGSMDIFWNHTLPNFIEVSSLQPIPPPLPKLTGTLYPARPESGSPSTWEVEMPGQYPGLRRYHSESVPVTDSEQVSQKQPESLHQFVRVTETVETFLRFVHLSILWLVINTAVLVLCMWKNEIQSGYQMLSFNGGCTHLLLLYCLCVHHPLLTPPTCFLGLYYVLFSHRQQQVVTLRVCASRRTEVCGGIGS